MVATRLLHAEIFLAIIPRTDRLDRNVQTGGAPITKENVRASLDIRNDKNLVGANRFSVVLTAVS